MASTKGPSDGLHLLVLTHGYRPHDNGVYVIVIFTTHTRKNEDICPTPSEEW